MREIKFRAWDKQNKDWVGVDDRYFCCKEDGWVDVWGSAIIGLSPSDNTLILMSSVFEICQYTGLKDKNGVEIYEGDFVKDRVGNIWLIKWDGEGTLEDGTDDWIYGYHFPHPSYEGKQLEVIGNIYENHELLEVK
jgi:uncharacterized phage protein (TIGR01671 family)